MIDLGVLRHGANLSENARRVTGARQVVDRAWTTRAEVDHAVDLVQRRGGARRRKWATSLRRDLASELR